ncbi:MAG: hypothetical protein H7Y05_13480 [Steroidobacteraceae bacterium]|nr:hypothetical protein [Deltaproteobacteria bacterium]
MSDNRKTSLILTMEPDRLGEFFPLLQQGVVVETQVGCTLDKILSQQWDIPPEYAAERITTIFLNSRPIDSLATTLIREDAVIALSGAMPGLVGATMRRGGYYAAMREGITHHDTTGDVTGRVAAVRVKLFNLLLAELGPGFLQRGINISASELSGFIKGRNDSFWQGCRSALLDNYPLLPPSLLREDRFPAGSTVRMSVNFPNP